MPNLRVYLEPNFDKPDTGEGGIRRVVEAQRKYLPQFGIEVVDDPTYADLTAGHGGARPLRQGVPFVCHSHGLYWSDYQWQNHEDNANRRVIDSLLCADAITVPSEWVRHAYTRGILRDIQVVYHGVEAEEWTPDRPGGFVLWNKPRHDAVSNVNDLNRIARLMPDIRFVSTLGNPASNVQLLGRMPYAAMKEVVQTSNVYLATARETFGIGTLEALASGVPVAGWNYGGQREIVVQGQTGYLADYGDWSALQDAIRRCLAERDRLSANAREDAVERWGWKDKIERYAQLYNKVLLAHVRQPKISIIVTCHNLARYLPAALQSVADQNLTDWECIIVDDASTDETFKIAGEWQDKDFRFRPVRSDVNVKLSGARNLGLSCARGKYVLYLDADDQLTPQTLERLANALDTNPHLHIVYGGLDLVSDDGTQRRANAFPGAFDYAGQMAHLNQLYYAALMRREVLEQSGGYRERMWRAEDASFWCRAVSFGFRAAKVTDEPCLLWRARPDGKSAQERKQYPDVDGDWTEMFPWAIAHTAKEGLAKRQAGFAFPNRGTLPFGAPINEVPIWHHEAPLVSIIIPLGEGHESRVIDALDSCVAQTFHDWEVIVVNDTGAVVPAIAGAPFARIINTPGKVGPGRARNLGVQAARGKLVLFLDADDMLDPTCLSLFVDTYGQGNAGYIYSGWKVVRPNKEVIEFEAKPYDRLTWLIGKNEGRNIVSVLMAKADVEKVGGFDERMAAYEDWDFFCKCAVAGLCGVPVNRFLVTYRHIYGLRSQFSGKPHHTELVTLIRARYDEYAKGAKEMSPCCGGNKGAVAAILAAKGMLQDSIPAEGYTRLRFVGERQGPVTYYANGRGYAGANMEGYRFAMVRNEDVDRLVATGVWVKIRQEAKDLPVTVPPVPEPPAPQVRPTIIPVGEPNVATTQVAAQAEAEATKSVGETTAKPKSKRRAKVGA